MKAIGSRALLAATMVWAGGVAAARAQATFQPNWAGWGSANIGVSVMGGAARAHAQRAPSAPAFRAPPRVRVATTYRRDPQVTRRVVENYSAYVARVAGPAKAQEVRAQLDRTDLPQAWSALTAPDGFRAGDAADALAAYWMLNWIMANRGDSDARHAAAVRAQLRGVLGSNPAFQRLSEAQRQEMAETYMVNFLYQQGAYTDAVRRHDADLQRRLSDAAEARFRNEMKIDLRGLALTDGGFAPRA